MFGISKEWFRNFRKSGSLLTFMTIVGVIAGIGLGILLRGVKDVWTPREIIYVRFVGDIFLRTLQALVLPLIVCSLIDAIGSMDLNLSRKIGARALLYYLTTTAIAAVLGVILAITIQPGYRNAADKNPVCVSHDTSTIDTILDLVRNIFPNNLIGATLQSTQTHVIDDGEDKPFNERSIELIMLPGANMMGLVVFATVVGISLGVMKETGVPVLLFFKSFSKITMLITSQVISFSPIAICSLIAGTLVEQKEDLGTIFTGIAWYFATVMIGLLIHGFIILPLTYIILTRTSPVQFVINMFQAMATAFGTASSAATLPVTLNCLEEKNGVDTIVTRFVIPIGATVNMNGAALYLPVATIFVAQLCGMPLGVGKLISLSLVTIAGAIGAAGVPSVAMLVLVSTFATVGLPANLIPHIVPVEWILDRCVTTINILGDSFGAAIVAKMSKSDIAKISNPVDFIDIESPSSFSEVDVNSSLPRVKLVNNTIN